MPSSESSTERYQKMSAKIRELINTMETEGCSCDILNGWVCGIHLFARHLRSEIYEMSLNLKREDDTDGGEG